MNMKLQLQVTIGKNDWHTMKKKWFHQLDMHTDKKVYASRNKETKQSLLAPTQKLNLKINVYILEIGKFMYSSYQGRISVNFGQLFTCKSSPLSCIPCCHIRQNLQQLASTVKTKNISLGLHNLNLPISHFLLMCNAPLILV